MKYLGKYQGVVDQLGLENLFLFKLPKGKLCLKYSNTEHLLYLGDEILLWTSATTNSKQRELQTSLHASILSHASDIKLWYSYVKEVCVYELMIEELQNGVYPNHNKTK